MQIWQRRCLTAWILWPLSLLFRLVVALRKTLFTLGILKSTRLSVPVIIVGNIFVGGTGKTPFVIWLVDALRKAGFNPGVISRGHGGNNTHPTPVNAEAKPEKVGDEPLLIYQRTKCPLYVGRNRVATSQALLAAHPDVDVIISDDGLQHYALRRDIEIILCDNRGNGNGLMLPAGPLREPADRRRDFTIINSPTTFHPAKNTYAMHLVGERAEHIADRSQSIALNALGSFAPETSPGKLKIAAAAGIGNPQRFFFFIAICRSAIFRNPLTGSF